MWTPLRSMSGCSSCLVVRLEYLQRLMLKSPEGKVRLEKLFGTLLGRLQFLAAGD